MEAIKGVIKAKLKGYGFIEAGGDDYYFHKSAVSDNYFNALRIGQPVLIIPGKNDIRGPSATIIFTKTDKGEVTKMLDVMAKRRKLQEQIQEARLQIDAINADVKLSAEGRGEKVKPIKEKVAELMQSAINDLQGAQKKHMAELEKVKLRANQEAVASRAAVIGPLLASMDDEAILNLYKARYNDLTERDLIEQFAAIRIDAAAADQIVGFRDAFARTKAALEKAEPVDPAARKLQAELKYIEAVATAIAYDLHEWQDNQVMGADAVKRTNALHAAAVFEKELSKQ